MHSSAAASQSIEKESVEGDTTAPHSSSPPRVLCSYQQHIADYVLSDYGRRRGVEPW